jgi:single-stranded DNA-binding protein
MVDLFVRLVLPLIAAGTIKPANAKSRLNFTMSLPGENWLRSAVKSSIKEAYIEGRLQTHSWEGQDGVKRSKTEIVADNVIAVGAPREGGGPGASTAPAEDFDQRPAEEKDKKLSARLPARQEAKSASGGVDKVEKVSKDDPKESEPEKKSATKNPPAGGDEEEIDLDDIPF